ncbi:MAG: hypothetical protein V7691_14990 [Galbibacter orientalis]|uniref:hypothetical protein n=1 Tax=Galbibacter orientalis TaxID=453852 RepID=UPI0030018B1D
MNKVLLIIILLTSISIFSQSKSETEKWIVEKYNEYESSVNHTRELIFDDGYIYYLWIFADNYGYWTQLPITEIKNIKIHHKKFDANDTEGWDVITLYYNKNKSKTKDAKPSENSYYEISESTSFEIKLSHNFIDDGLKPRMEKALIHLVKSYGGNATIKKEPF